MGLGFKIRLLFCKQLLVSIEPLLLLHKCFSFSAFEQKEG